MFIHPLIPPPFIIYTSQTQHTIDNIVTSIVVAGNCKADFDLKLLHHRRISTITTTIYLHTPFSTERRIPLPISKDTVDELPTTPSVDDLQDTPSASAYEYSNRCSFKPLHSPKIELLMKMLQKNADYVGFRDKTELLSESGRKQLTSIQFWDTFAKKTSIAIRSSLAEKKSELRTKKKNLTMMERVIICEFASTHAPHITSDLFVNPRCQALLNVLGSVLLPF